MFEFYTLCVDKIKCSNMLKIDGVNYQNKQYSVKNNSNYLAYANNNQTDSVSFKSKLTILS